MYEKPIEDGLRRNIRLYPWYTAGFNAFAWMPVFFLYFSEHITLEQVLRLEVIYYAAVVLLEVPSGYFSDTVGRRPTLLISTLALLAAYVLFVVDTTFVAFAVAQVCLATGVSFNSGTDTSFHYDSLASLGRHQEFGDREAIAARNGLLSSGLAALLGGAIATFALHYAYVLSAVAAIFTVGIGLAFVEPAKHERATALGQGFFGQLRSCMGLVRRPALAWLFGFSVLMTVLNHVPYEFFQPYIRLSIASGELFVSLTPLVAGIHMAVAMLIGSYAAAVSIRLCNRFGSGPTFMIAGLTQAAVIGAMGFVLDPWVIPLILLRVMPRALMTAPLNAAVAPRVAQSQRATYLSIQSLAGRLSFSVVLLALSFLAGPEATTDWESLSLLLRVCLVLAIGGLLALGVTQRSCLASSDLADGRHGNDERSTGADNNGQS